MPAVVFDLDGTLVDSARDLAAAGNALLAEYARPPLPDEAIAAMVGEGARVLVQRLFEAAEVEAPVDEGLARFLAAYDGRLLETTRPYDGIPELLDALAQRRLSMAVLTNKPRAMSQRLVEGLGLAHYFTDVYGGDGPFPRKPDPAGLIHLRDAAGGRALLVGDSPADLHTALAAGVPACLVRYGFGFAKLSDGERSQATWIVDQPQELLALVEQWGTGSRQ
jgi:phosphoglycolate phosphatase